MSDFPFLYEGIILDACCIINLYASGYMKHILESIPKSIAIAAYVRDVETQRIYSGPVENVTRETALINLQPFIDEGLLHVVSPENDAEENTVVNFSATAALDSGEAITAAIAMHRQWSLVTDDKGAISFFMREIPQLHMMTTLDLLKYWIDTTCQQLTTVNMALENIRIRARYKPHFKHHLYSWWELYIGSQQK